MEIASNDTMPHLLERARVASVRAALEVGPQVLDEVREKNTRADKARQCSLNDSCSSRWALLSAAGLEGCCCRCCRLQARWLQLADGEVCERGRRQGKGRQSERGREEERRGTDERPPLRVHVLTERTRVPSTAAAAAVAAAAASYAPPAALRPQCPPSAPRRPLAVQSAAVAAPASVRMQSACAA
jgi:hypothetical protein